MLIEFRREMKRVYGLGVRDELRAFNFISSPGPRLIHIMRYDRLAILRKLLDLLASMPDLNVFAVVVDKQQKPVGFDVFEMAWKALIQRFENTMSYRNFAGLANADERGILFPDDSEAKRLLTLLRRMRYFNPIPNQGGRGGYRSLPLVNVVEDPNFRRSDHSFFIQAADTIAYFVNQSHAPNAYIRKKSAQNYFKRLEPVLVKRVSSTNDGIVHL